MPPPAIRDPVAYCVWATVALLAWLLSPPLIVAVESFAADEHTYVGCISIDHCRNTGPIGSIRTECVQA